MISDKKVDQRVESTPVEGLKNVMALRIKVNHVKEMEIRKK